MKVLYQAIILLGLFKLLTSNKLRTINNTMCVDCSKDPKVECIIEDTGFECFKEHVPKKPKGVPLRTKPARTKNLDVCIPKDLTIPCINDKLFLKVIVWSPQLGCQIVQRGNKNRDTCFVASLICPCVRSQKGSGEVQSTYSLLLIITLYLVQLKITKTN
ncbi:uncharacterized protein LOC26526562 [Drosophila erecta]|uniref:Uncharacterized protein n=1 Tax=Drosophila erecta TaxID=7220 RepID=A0A0Q5VUL5_DROER|nr:uncharacterized protein LOC26526562 [Drosophila erecta]KQS62613.1 uncharacterized protein Dere_GG26738 [Drosophila erecta]